jgi:multidrug efflux pump subunit AcrA (membrane-fusion protein)
MIKIPSLSKRVVILVVTVATATFIFSCSKKEQEVTPVVNGTPVMIGNPSVSSLTEYMDFNATTVFLKKEIVRSTFQGFVQKTYKNIGDHIHQGDVVIQLITKEASAADSAQLSLSTQLFHGSVDIKAKSNGVLTELNFNAGDFVSEGEQLAVISNPLSAAVLLSVPYQHIAKININAKCLLILPNGKKISGTIARSLPSVDPVSQTQVFIIQCDGLKDIPANLNLIVKIHTREVNHAIVIPKSAIQTNETLDDFWIMKLVDDTTAMKVPVRTGIENDSLVQILNPQLKLTDRIIFDGAYGLADTAKVLVHQ